jgi:hypothetical protein
MPVPANFEHHFQSYLAKANEAKANNQHHDYRRQIFLEFLKDAYNLKLSDFEIEKFVRLEMRRTGWVDALFRDLVFEFKRDLERERDEGKRELRDYLQNLGYGDESIGLLTDGLVFEVYTLDGEDLQKGDVFDLSDLEDETAFLTLDAYLFSQKGVPPTSADIVRRFGSRSPTFHTASRVLCDLLLQLSDTPALKLKRQLWRGLLAKVYGSDIGDDDLFIRHTYLNQLAKLLAFAALKDEIPRGEQELADIIIGEAYNRFGVNNLGEIDFFSWMLESEVRSEAIAMLRRLAQSLVTYDLSRIGEDLFKQLYQNLVDPETRHILGEFYTPDWLAELTLRSINYQPGQSLLDPACGSGTFLFTAIRRLAEQGMAGWELVDFAVANIAGMDVHPLAVTIARINYLLAIIPHMHGARPSGQTGLIALPVYMADSLQTPEDVGLHKDTLIVPVDVDRDEHFFIPKNAAEAPGVFTGMIDQMEAYAGYSIDDLNFGLSQDFLALVQKHFGVAQRGNHDLSRTYWLQNLRLLNALIHEERNSIWAYILKNMACPLLLSARRFDVIAGNPPWLTYKDIRDKAYQSEVRYLTISRYELLESKDAKLFTQMELSTLFMVHCEKTYLRKGGTIAFVMPRSTITGAKQHRPFQARGITHILDLLGVFPLFKIPSCVLIRRADELHADDVPTTRYEARLPAHEMTLEAAQAHSTWKMSEAVTRMVGEVSVASPHYYDRFKQGATLVPRNLCFVRPRQQLQAGDAAVNPAMETDPDVDRDAKKPWKGVRLEGLIYPPNLYATLLSKNMIPFGYRRLHLVALPVHLAGDELKPTGEHEFLRVGHVRSWQTWFQPAESIWDDLKKETSRLENLIDQYDYQQKLTSQRPSGYFKVLYNASGVHLVAAVIDTRGSPPKVYEYPTQSFIADAKTYWFNADTIDEAHYLCALLNAPCVDDAIKPFQSRGKGRIGERDVHRTPFEACAIPPFDQDNPDHLKLARLSREAHKIISETEFTGAVVKARNIAREAVAEQIAAIDVIARRVLGLE